MVRFTPRVDYLADFCRPLGGPAAGRPRVLCHGAEIFLSTGRERVYVYDREQRLLTVSAGAGAGPQGLRGAACGEAGSGSSRGADALEELVGKKRVRAVLCLPDVQAVYTFPGQVWHLEVLALRRALYVLCARRGIYCLSLDQTRRSPSQNDGDDAGSEPPSPATPVDPAACVLPDATLCTFTVLDTMLVTLAQGPAHWKVQLFRCPCPGQDLGQIGEVDLSTCTPLAGSPGEPKAALLLPVLCCVSPPGSGVPRGHPGGAGGFTLEGSLFGLLFGADAALLESPVLLVGLPSGQLCCVVLKSLGTSGLAPRDPKAAVKVLHHLEEPVIFIGALRTEPLAEDMEDTYSDCLVALGHHGRTLAIKARRDEAGSLEPGLREYWLPGPVLCAACGGDGQVYHSTPSGLCVVDLARASAPWDPVQPRACPGSLPSLPCPASLRVCSVLALSVSSGVPEGDTKLLALSAKGRLMTCSLDLSSEASRPTAETAVNSGRKVKELLGAIGSISERASSLEKAVDQRNRALTHLNEAMNVSCTLLSSREGPRPVSCTATAAWSRLGLRDVLTAACLLENRSAFSLGPGWALCVQLLPSSRTSDLGSAGSAVTCTLPVGQLGPGGRREVTLPLGPGEDGVLNLPVTLSCWLFYSLREVVGGALAPSGSFRDPSLDGGASDITPEQDGVCLPLGEHTVDMLQALRFPGLAAPCTPSPGPPGPAGDPVDTFLAAQCRLGSEPAGPASLQAKYLPPSAAAVKVSAELLRAALGDGHSGTALCCATLQWLLAGNAVVDVVRARALSSVQGVAPNGADIHLAVHEVAVTDLCPAGPVSAIEIQVESRSLASTCGAHHAVITRVQRMVTEQAAQGPSPPDLRVQCLHQIQANHETLLREVQTLRDRLSTEDEARSCAAAERLLQVYRMLRSPSLVLL